MVSKSVLSALKLSKNRIFLRQLFRLPYGSKKSERMKTLNLGDKKQRHLLIHILHQIIKGEIPMKKEHSSIVLQSGKVDFFQKHFLETSDVRRLLTSTDQEQKEVLAKVNNYHVLLYRLFNLN